MNTPYHTEASEFSAGVVHNGVAYLPYPMFSIYFEAGAVVHRQVLSNLVNLLLENQRKITTNLPVGGRVTLRTQDAENRDIVHLLYATPQLRGTFNGQPVEIIQDLPELRQISVNLRTDRLVSAVKLVPDNADVVFEQAEGEVKFTVDKIQGHQMVAVSYSD